MNADPKVNVMVGRGRIGFGKGRLTPRRRIERIKRRYRTRPVRYLHQYGYPAPVGGNQAVKDSSALGQIPQGADLMPRP